MNCAAELNVLAPRGSTFARGLVRALARAGVDVRAGDYRVPTFTLWDSARPLLARAPTLALRGERVNPAVWAALRGPKVLWWCEALVNRNVRELAELRQHYDVLWHHIDTPEVRRALEEHGIGAFVHVPCLGADPEDWRVEIAGGWRAGPRHTHDAVFVGAMTPRRQRLLNELRRRGLRILAAEEWDVARAARLLLRAPVALNLHAHEWLNTETRLAELDVAGAFTLSERTAGAHVAPRWAELRRWPTDIDELAHAVKTRAAARGPDGGELTFDALVPRVLAALAGVDAAR